MNTRIVIVTVALLLSSMLLLTGCNTWEGAGKDIENMGENMQDK